MTEAILAVLLAVASALGALFWRKANTAERAARDTVDRLRDQAQEANETREETVLANMESLERELEQIGTSQEDLQALADKLNHG